MAASTFYDDYFTNVQLIEFPDILDQPLVRAASDASNDTMNVDEMSRCAASEGTMDVDEGS